LKASFSGIPSVSRRVRRIACTASGPLAAINSASSSALRSAWPSGTTWPINPISLASAAWMCRPVNSRSAATVYGIWRVSRTAEPPSGNSPQRGSDTPKRALCPATRMSVACKISVPPAIAGPSTAAISGLVRRRPLSSGSITERSMPPEVSPGWLLVMALRSAPAQNDPPAPVRRQERISALPSTSFQASRMIAIIGAVSALRAAGRFIVTTKVAPWRSTKQCGSSVIENLRRGSGYCAKR